MSTFEFITVLLSIVVGLGITRLLGGLARAIEIRGSLKSYWVQAVWSINVGLYLVVFWWVVVFSYSRHDPWVFLNFLHLFLYSTLLFLQAVLIIPRDLEEGTDLAAHFFTVRPWFFGIGAIIPIVETGDSLMHGLENLLSFGPAYILMQLSALVLNLVAATTDNRRFHAVFCIGYFLVMGSWTVSRFWTIG
jgi:hypothetical protein